MLTGHPARSADFQSAVSQNSILRSACSCSVFRILGRPADCKSAIQQSATLRYGTRPNRAGFTLIELILVMALLGIVLAVSAPSLSRFFKGRGLDNEAQRFVALTRAAQSRAVSEGVPMVVWFDIKERTYGLNADKSYVEDDPNALEFTVDTTLEMDARFSSEASFAHQTTEFKNEKLGTSGLYLLHFNPDGFIGLSSPEAVIFRQGKDAELWVAQSRNRLNYEIQAGRQIARR